MQTVISILAFHFIFQPIGMRTSSIKGDYMLYISIWNRNVYNTQ
jgi:hypothetical protein